ncbi:hypothetical protein C8R46DRAFT_1319417 [Mycena filopes]|nr:hypothetical protein C8R46DRAFT_1319417 [Mycena filopes]
MPPRRVPRRARQDLVEAADDPILNIAITESYAHDSDVKRYTRRTAYDRGVLLDSLATWTKSRFKDILILHQKPFHDDPHLPVDARLERRLHAYLNSRVTISVGVSVPGDDDDDDDDDDDEEEDATGDAQASRKRARPRHMKYNSLLTLKLNLLNLLKDNVRMSKEQAEGWSELMTSWCLAAKVKFNLLSTKRRGLIFGVAELRILIAQALHNPRCWESALQYVVMLLLAFYTGCRPSTVFRQKHRSTFLQLLRLVVSRSQLSGHPAGLDTAVHYVVFKGYDDNQLQIDYTILFPSDPDNLFAYLGGYLMLLQLLRGEVVGHQTWADVLNSDVHTFEWTHPQRPVFRSMKSRTVVGLEPQTDENFRDKHHQIALRCGMDGFSGTKKSGLYGFRKNFGTKMLQAHGADSARLAMGHRFNTASLFTSYDQTLSTLDFAAIGTSEADRSGQSYTGNEPALYAKSEVVVPMGPEELLKTAPELAYVLADISYVEEIVNGGEPVSDWQLALKCNCLVQETDTPLTMLVWLIKRAKYIARGAQTSHYKRTLHERAQRRQTDISHSEFTERVRQLAHPAILQDDLAARVKALTRSPREGLVRVSAAEDPASREVYVHVIVAAGVDEEEVPSRAQAVGPAAATMFSDLFILVQAPRLYICDACWDDPTTLPSHRGKEYVDQKSFNLHAERYHSPEGVLSRVCQDVLEAREGDHWVCPWCEKSSWTKHARLVQHLLDHHRQQLDQLAEPLQAAAEAKAQGEKTEAANSTTSAPSTSAVSTLLGRSRGRPKNAPLPSSELQCPECRDDISLPEADRVKVYSAVRAVQVHRAAKVHDPAARAVRMLLLDSPSGTIIQKGDLLTSLACPYGACVQQLPLVALCAHIASSHPELPSPKRQIFGAAFPERPEDLFETLTQALGGIDVGVASELDLDLSDFPDLPSFPELPPFP